MTLSRWCVVALGLGLVLGASGRVEAAGLSGKYDVRTIEFALDLQPGASRVRVTLTNGQALDVALADQETTARVLLMMGAMGQGGRVAVRVEDGEVRAFHLVVPGRS